MNQIAKIIENRLCCIINVQLSQVGRAGNLAWFCFGEDVAVQNYKGENTIKSEYSLNVQCAFRIVQDKKIILASSDMYIPNSKMQFVHEFDWDVQGANRFDELAKAWKGNTIIVDSLKSDDFGGLKIYFSNEAVLEIFPDMSAPEECWRFFECQSAEKHVVITGQGILA